MGINRLMKKEVKNDLSKPSINKVRPKSYIFGNGEKSDLYLEVPGITEKDISIEIDDYKLRVYAERCKLSPNGSKEADHVPVYAYERIFTIGKEFDLNKVEAKLSKGLLHLTVPLAEAAKPRKIEVKVT